MGKSPVRDDVVPLMEEAMSVAKREVTTGTVRVTTKTATHEEIAETTLKHDAFDVFRVPIDLPVDTIPPVRTDGETTIFPVVEERLVVSKQLVLVEELHIRRRIEQDVVRTPVQLRRQDAVIKRLDNEGGVDLHGNQPLVERQ